MVVCIMKLTGGHKDQSLFVLNFNNFLIRALIRPAKMETGDENSIKNESLSLILLLLVE